MHSMLLANLSASGLLFWTSRWLYIGTTTVETPIDRIAVEKAIMFMDMLKASVWEVAP